MKTCIFWIVKSIKITLIFIIETRLQAQYMNYHSQTPWKLKTSWTKALCHCSYKTCSNKQSLNKEILEFKRFML